jgi:hypothetical protein
MLKIYKIQRTVISAYAVIYKVMQKSLFTCKNKCSEWIKTVPTVNLRTHAPDDLCHVRRRVSKGTFGSVLQYHSLCLFSIVKIGLQQFSLTTDT